MDVYAQLEQRADRSHGTNFDRLMHDAREQRDALPAEPGFASRGEQLAQVRP